MTVLPADHRADLQKLEKIDGEPAALETEEEFESLFPNCAKGAMRPFGNLYGLLTCVDKRLTQEDYIVFEAGTHIHGQDNGRFADYFIHLLLGIKLRDAPVGSTIWIQRI